MSALLIFASLHVGEQDVDAEWLQEMAEPTVDGKTVKIVPRVIVETLSQPDLVALLTENIERRAFASTLYQLCTKHKFDGIMLELWSRIQVTPDMRTLLAESVSNIGKRLHNKQLLFGIIVPPLNDSFGAVELRTLQNDVDLFAMNTYDYSQPTTAGPNAPYLWVENCLKDLKPNELDTSKLLMGLNW
jgi:chitinase domain-containing protein 1